MIILKNTSMSTKNWGGIDIPAESQYEIQEVDRVRLLSDSAFINDLDSNIAVINDGSDDLNSNMGRLLIARQVFLVHEDISLLPFSGENAPEFVNVSSAVFGHKMSIDDVIYGQTRIDNLVGDQVRIQIHLTIDNNVADRWIKFELSVFSSNLNENKATNIVDDTFTLDLKEVPSTPWYSFEIHKDIPLTMFNNGERYLLFSLKRIVATGKIAPINDPIVLRYCKEYYRGVE